MQFLVRAAATMTLLALVGCGTPYSEGMGWRGGTEVMQINQTTYQISSHGNAYTTEREVYKHALRRAASLGHQLGFASFAVSSDSSSKKTNYRSNSTITDCSGYIKPLSCRNDGPMVTTNTTAQDKHSRFFIVQYFRDRSTSGDRYDIDLILSQIAD